METQDISSPGDHQAALVEKNLSWWNELCGTNAARLWGITDDSPDSLKRFDENFFKFYPYIDDWIDWSELADKKTLEVGLGYGSITQRLTENGAILTAMDIASNPIAMAQHRFNLIGSKNSRTVQGNILSPQADIGKFERIVAIGCLHHTGNLAKAIDICYDLLEPGGKLIGMVYYTFSHRQWWNNPAMTARQAWREFIGHRGTFGAKIDTSAYDLNSDGSLAPATEFASKRTLYKYCSRFSSVKAKAENVNSERPFTRWHRETLLKTFIPRIFGLDLYWIATK